MSQSKLSDYFTIRKGSSSIQPSKRLKLNHDAVLSAQSETDTARSSSSCEHKAKVRRSSRMPSLVNSKRKRRIEAESKSSVTLKSYVKFGSEKEINKVREVNAAAFDDHNASPPNSPIKTSSTGNKRVRQPKPLDMLMDSFKTPERGFDFSVNLGNKSTAVRKRLILSPKSVKTNAETVTKVFKVRFHVSVSVIRIYVSKEKVFDAATSFRIICLICPVCILGI